MTHALYQRKTLIGVVKSLKRPKTWFLNRYFAAIHRFDTENVVLDVEIRRRRVAAYCSPLVAGKVIAEGTFRSREMVPAYINETKIMRPLRSMQRAMGETIGGNDAGRPMSNLQRHQERLALETFESIEAVQRAKELQAVQGLVSDQVIIAADGVPTNAITFGRSDALKIVLAPGARWNEAGSDPGRDIGKWTELVHREEGAKIDCVVMDPDAWDAASSNETFLKKLDNRRAVAGEVQIGPASLADGPSYKGMLGDQEVWVYSDYYDDPITGELTPYLPSGTVLGLSPQIEGVQLHGAILDEEAGIQAMEFFPNTWLERNPSRRMLQIQSAPLVGPRRPNASYSAKVL